MPETLICITSCNRLDELRKHALPYIRYCNETNNTSFLVSVDGPEGDYSQFCKAYNIPLLYSDVREGVGLSKNRVLQQFPNFDYYFFIDDDVELLDCTVFDDFIKVHQLTGYHHMSANYLREIEKTENIKEYTLQYAKFGGAYFNFFTREGLKRVGGWHPLFAQYKRYGHTEQTYRFWHQQLQPAPFIAILSINEKLMLHNPPHVSIESNNVNKVSELVDDEEKMISQQTTFCPITTISPFYFNGYDMDFNPVVKEFILKNNRHYPLTTGKIRRVALAEYYFEMFRRKHGLIVRYKFLFLSFINYPFSNPLKHYIKSKLGMKND